MASNKMSESESIIIAYNKSTKRFDISTTGFQQEVTGEYVNMVSLAGILVDNANENIKMMLYKRRMQE